MAIRTPPDRRLLVAIAGPPGSGKSTLAYPLTDRINTLLHCPPSHPSHVIPDEALAVPSDAPGGIAICVGLDGWHYSRAVLDTFADPVDAHWRRGAAFTFDLPAYLTFLSCLRLSLSDPQPKAIPYPTFDHAIGDPLVSPTPITPENRIIVVEGLYTLLDKNGWRECAEQFDVRIWVDCAEDVAKERVVRRNFAAGIVKDLEQCRARVDAVDMKNGEEVRRHLMTPTDVFESVDELRTSI